MLDVCAFGNIPQQLLEKICAANKPLAPFIAGAPHIESLILTLICDRGVTMIWSIVGMDYNFSSALISQYKG